MAQARFITALGTPLTDDDRLHTEGLGRHLDDQAAAGIDSLLVGGTMGMMPLLTDDTWKNLLQQSIELGRGRFEMLVGATDISTSRAMDRVAYVNTLRGVDGVVVMVPGFFEFTGQHYIDYFYALAETSHYPLYLYDVQGLTNVHLSVETILKLAEHPNIVGIKMSENIPDLARLKLHLDGAPFRLIVAEPTISDMLFRHGYSEHLDGIYVFAPHWAVSLAAAAQSGDWEEAAAWQAKLTGIKELFLTMPVHEVFTALMNARGIAGRFTPRPMTATASMRDKVLAMPIVQQLLATAPAGMLK